MNQLKIAVFHNLPSGGAKRALHGHLKFLKENNHIVDVFIPETANEKFIPLKDVSNKIIEFSVKPSFIRTKIYSIFDYVPAIFKEVSIDNVIQTEKIIAETINDADYDIVFVEQDQYTMSPAVLKYLKKPAVYYCQQPPRKEKIIDNINEVKRKDRLLEPLIQQYIKRVSEKEIERDFEFAKYADNILVNSYFSHESVLRQYGKNSHVSYLGVDNTIFKPLNIERKNFILSVGTCIPTKGYDFVIHSLSLVPENIRPKLLIVGNSSDELWVKYLYDLAEECDVDLDILSLISDDKLVKLYNEAKLVIYTPYLEPFGFVPLESMACGTPIVGVKEGGVKETIVHNKTGLLVQRDPNEIADAIVKLLTDDELWEQFSINSIAYIEAAWTLDSAGNRLLDNLKRVINK
ncbi:MAG: glycosyltransferase family 4 protein [Methanobacteriaceae archaeon]|nr:glycosyltransferase family 4 protein [Methanobacteriaceae archaeon]